MKKNLMIALILVVLPLSSANAITITYDATEKGANVWQFDYYVSDFDFYIDYGFTIFYEYGLYENIIAISDSDDWDELVIPPDLIVPDDGFYDALAYVDNASLSEPFSVEFTWLGPGNPNGQYFEVYNDTSWDPVDSGQTEPVPEPATIFLIGAGLLGLGIQARRKTGKI